MRRMNWFLFLLLLFILFGCSPIAKNLRIQADQTLVFHEVFQNPEAYKGNIVIWGGEIVQTINQKDETTLIEVLQKPLDWMEKPTEETSDGRFLVLVEGFLNPHTYREGREITVAGEILGEKTKVLGELEYRYPLLLSEQIHLWREHYYRHPPYNLYFPYYPWGDYAYYDPWRYYDHGVGLSLLMGSVGPLVKPPFPFDQENLPRLGHIDIDLIEPVCQGRALELDFLAEYDLKFGTPICSNQKRQTNVCVRSGHGYDLAVKIIYKRD